MKKLFKPLFEIAFTIGLSFLITFGTIFCINYFLINPFTYGFILLNSFTSSIPLVLGVVIRGVSQHHIIPAILFSLGITQLMITLLACCSMIPALIIAGLITSPVFILPMMDLFRAIPDVFTPIFSLFNYFIALLNSFVSSNQATEKTLEEECEAIILKLQIEPSIAAQEKAEVLQLLLDHIRIDLTKIHPQANLKTTEAYFAKLIHKKYDISLKGSSYTLSFYEVASIARKNNVPFEIPKTKEAILKFNFFKTKSERTLSSYLDSMEKTAPNLAFN